jgi:hypothetical protein
MTETQTSFLQFGVNTIRVRSQNAVRARASDPQTSQDAASQLQSAGSHCAMILRLYAQNPNGLTDSEVEQTGVVYQAWKQCSDLRKWGLIEPKTDEAGETVTRTGPRGRAQQVCVITALGKTT